MKFPVMPQFRLKSERLKRAVCKVVCQLGGSAIKETLLLIYVIVNNMVWAKGNFAGMMRKLTGVNTSAAPKQDGKKPCPRCKAHGCCTRKGCLDTCNCLHYVVQVPFHFNGPFP